MALTEVNGTIVLDSDEDKPRGKPSRLTITLEDKKDIDSVCKMIKDDEDFILTDEDEETAELIIANSLSAKLANGELTIIANFADDSDTD